MRYLVEIPSEDGRAAVRNFVEDWLGQPALRRIVESDGGAWPDGPLEERAAALYEFSSKWDFRDGSERLELGADDSDLDDAELLGAASELGLTGASLPASNAYEHGLTLGGTALASIFRVKYLYELRQSTEIESIGVLTALREVSAKEKALVREREEIAHLVSDAVSEFDVMLAATEDFSGVAAESDEQASAKATEARVGDAVVLAANSPDPARRANTPDNYDVYARRISAGDSVLVVTSSIYLPYQFFIALQALGWERPLTIEAVGFPPEWMRGVLTGPQNILQELRSAIDAAKRTLDALAKDSG